VTLYDPEPPDEALITLDTVAGFLGGLVAAAVGIVVLARRYWWTA